MYETATLLTKILTSMWLIFPMIESYISLLYVEKSVWHIIVFRSLCFAQSYLFKAYNFWELREMRTKLKPRDASSKQNAFPMP